MKPFILVLLGLLLVGSAHRRVENYSLEGPASSEPTGDVILCINVSDGVLEGKPVYNFSFDKAYGSGCGRDVGWALESAWAKTNTGRTCQIDGNTWMIYRLDVK